jgi:carboxyl-terminal processing protease
VDLASHFLPKGTLVTYSESTIEGRTDYVAKRDPDIDPSIPLVILLDQRSASASEILALALKQQRPNTTIVGTKSFGK